MESVSVFATLSILAATVMQAYATTDNKCDNLSSIIGKFTVCLMMNSTSTLLASFMRLLQDDQALTRNKFLTELDTMCSNSEIKQPYLNCAEEIENVCIAVDIMGYISTNVDERRAFFCENNTASSWMHEVLPDNYMFDRSCLANDTLVTIFQTCFRNISESLGSSLENLMNLSFDTALPLLYEIYYKSFPCVMDQAEESFPSDLKLDCGSAWQDVLLFYWLNHSGSSAFGPVLRREEMHRIEEMMSNRSERK